MLSRILGGFENLQGFSFQSVRTPIVATWLKTVVPYLILYSIHGVTNARF